MDKTFTLTLAEGEMNLVWGMANNCQIKGADAPVLVSLMQKLQMAVQQQVETPVMEPEVVEEAE